MIRGIVDATGVKIDVDDTGRVNVASSDADGLARAIQMISDITAVPEVGKTYLGKVVRLAEFGAFVEIFPGTDGLLHVSEIAEHRVKDVKDELREGDQVLVKVLAIEGNRIKLSRKAVLREQRAKLGLPEVPEAGGGEREKAANVPELRRDGACARRRRDCRNADDEGRCRHDRGDDDHDERALDPCCGRTRPADAHLATPRTTRSRRGVGAATARGRPLACTAGTPWLQARRSYHLNGRTTRSMAIEHTFSILKPDVTRRNLTGAVNAMIEKAGLRIVAQRRVHMTRAQAETFYGVHKARPFFGELVETMTAGPVVVQVLEGENAIKTYRDVLGATDPAKAEPGTIRKEHAISVGENSAHGSDAVETAQAEIAQWFSGNDITG